MSFLQINRLFFQSEINSKTFCLMEGYYRWETICTESPQVEVNKMMVPAGEVNCTVVLKRTSIYNFKMTFMCTIIFLQ